MGETISHFSRHGVSDVDSSTVASAQNVPAADTIQTVVLTHTVSGGAILLDSISCTGDWKALVEVYINASAEESKSISALSPNADFIYISPRRLENGDVLEVKVTQSSGSSQSYDASAKMHR